MNRRQGRKRLNILTIDGGGYQGISNLFILTNLMKAIAEQRGLKSQAFRPCDVFDVICGVGSGGWIALLLGRFMLSVSECYYEYCNIAKAIVRPDTAKSVCSRHFHHSLYDMKRLIAYVDHLTEKYKTGPNMAAADTGDVRCKQTFAVASYRAGGSSGHCLFRTYSAGGQDSGLSPDPTRTSISDAFAATGTKRGLLYPFKLELRRGTTVKFGSEKIQDCLTNPTVIALDEVARVYGAQTEISAVVNIGPGVPPAEDLSQIYSMVVRRISWGSTSSKCSKSSKDSKISKGSGSSGGSSWHVIVGLGHSSGSDRQSKDYISIPEQGSPSSNTASDIPPPKQQYSPPTQRCRLPTLICSITMPEPTELHRQFKNKQSSNITEIDTRVKGMDDTAVYVRLGPEDAPKDTATNDVMGKAPNEAQKTAMEYLAREDVKESIMGLARRIPEAIEEVEDG